MRPTDKLKEEHKAIKEMLGVLGRICTRLKAGEGIDPAHLDQVVAFLRGFADKRHHGKEENLLFPAMEKAGFPREHGPLAVMLMEHTEGRNDVAALSGAIALYKDSNRKETAGIISAGERYIRLLTDHIEKEDNVLFPTADMHIPETYQRELLEQFAQADAETTGERKVEEFRVMITELTKTYPS